MSRAVWYCVPESCTESRYKLSLNSTFPLVMHDIGMVCDECAEDYWDNHDGSEARWPLEFQIFETEESENPIAIFEVDMEAIPTFSSNAKEVKAESKEG